MFGGNKLRCPHCKGDDVSVQFVEMGSTTRKSGNGLGGIVHNTARAGAAVATLGLSNLLIPKAKGKEKTKNQMQKMCLCQSCGYSWPIK